MRAVLLFFYTYILSMGKIIDYINQKPLEMVWQEVFGRPLPLGKFECPNPLHNHVSHTPSCKVYGNVFKCFGQCNRVFGPYNLYKWYAPERIIEISRTELCEPSKKQPTVLQTVHLHGSVEEVVEQLIKAAQ